MRLAGIVEPDVGICDETGPTCTISSGGSFTLAVELVSVPVTGYVLAESWVEFGTNLTYNPAEDARDEMVWPDCEQTAVLRSVANDNSHVDIGCLTGLLDAPPSFYIGTFVELSLSCSFFESSTDVYLFVREEGIAVGPGTVFAVPVALGGTHIRPEVDGLTVNCLAAQTGTPTPTTMNTPTSTTEPVSVETLTPTATATEPPDTTPIATQTPTLDPNAPPTWTPEPTWTLEQAPTEMPTPTLATPQLQPGDANCDGRVDPLDAAFILQLVARLISSLPCPDGGDPSGDGVVDATDAALILQLSAGLIDVLPA